jgi:hypothetical protein
VYPLLPSGNRSVIECHNWLFPSHQYAYRAQCIVRAFNTSPPISSLPSISSSLSSLIAAPRIVSTGVRSSSIVTNRRPQINSSDAICNGPPSSKSADERHSYFNRFSEEDKQPLLLTSPSVIRARANLDADITSYINHLQQVASGGSNNSSSSSDTNNNNDINSNSGYGGYGACVMHWSLSINGGDGGLSPPRHESYTHDGDDDTHYYIEDEENDMKISMAEYSSLSDFDRIQYQTKLHLRRIKRLNEEEQKDTADQLLQGHDTNHDANDHDDYGDDV